MHFSIPQFCPRVVVNNFFTDQSCKPFILSKNTINSRQQAFKITVTQQWMKAAQKRKAALGLGCVPSDNKSHLDFNEFNGQTCF